MKVFEDFLKGIDILEHRSRTKEVLSWVSRQFPNLQIILLFGENKTLTIPYNGTIWKKWNIIKTLDFIVWDC